jgi:hypothetical protein
VEREKKSLDKLNFTAKIMTFRVCIRGKNFFAKWTAWVSRDTEFYVDFKNINLP